MSAGPDTRDEDLAELYEDAPCGYLSTEPSGTIVRVNRTLCRWTGRAAEALLGRRLPDLLSGAGALFYETHCLALLRLQGFLSEIAIDLLAADGRALPVLLNAVVKADAAGAVRVVRVVVVHADTRREVERELRIARRQAEETSELLRVQAELLAEHAAMLIPVSDDLRVMPILGAIDPARGRTILRALLHLDDARAVILDLTGVPELDAAAIETLHRAAAALRLRGVQAIFSGIRPAVAATLVRLGLDRTDVPVCATLQAGIALAARLGRR